jgi:hypothetical protein
LLELPKALYVNGFEGPETLALRVDRLLADAVCFFATFVIGVLSASRRILTICSSLNRLFLMASSFQKAILSDIKRSKNP